ncbi:FmdB family zinc ribbon protein [Koleobacter methoxysyntrophicus]|jgi:putative FmdB family regulatory protein|uniref:FmdB family zinc ribbon protein n=1 Tax=Koleobacter methoxysyntrophicus TaxID=2751313 RepID=UPI0019D54D5C|nr:zinc ribbon domain-containing protein [Koleobacter methoxysyntrophicus]NPV44469.1 zinc ribbon domain-containing protein [Bacillota bacterium]
MPIYDFKCKDCGHEFSTLTSHRNRDAVKCPECNSKNIKQEFKPFAIGSNSSTSSQGCSSG